jgi:hypothetical protein
MKKMLLLLAVVIIVGKSYGQIWNGNPTVNNLICGTSVATTKSGNVSVSDGAGGMYVAWIDSRVSSNQSIYVQRILTDGSVKFSSEVLVSNATGTTSSQKSSLSIEADGKSGVILVWQDQRNYTSTVSNNDVYGQRVDSSGNVLWATDGVRLAVANATVSSKVGPTISVINATEAIAVFGDGRNTGNGNDLYAQKIALSNGASLWASDINIHGIQPNTQTSFSILPDGNNGAFIVWQDPRIATTNSDIYAQHIDNSGALLWGETGTAVCTAAFNQLAPQMVSDGAGGFVVVWQDNRVASADGDIWAQRFNSSGVAQWTANGIAICVQASSNQSNPYIIASGGKYIVIWADPRAAVSNRNLYVNSIDNDGALQWGTAASGGIAISVSTGHQPQSSTQSGTKIVPDGSGGAILIWDDGRNGSSNIDMYAQRINSSGVVQWTADGVVVSSATGNQQTPNVALDASNNVIIAWRDGRTNSTSNGEIYASKLTLAGLLPVSFLSVSATAKAISVDVEWSTASELNNSHFVVERSIDGTNFSAIATVTAKGTASAYAYNDASAEKGDNYYRIVSVDKDGSTQLSKTVKASLQSVNSSRLQVYPNPTKAQTVIKLQGVASGKLQLKVIDAKGVLVSIISTTAAELAASKTINLQALQNGVYAIQIVNASGDILTSKMILKY